MSGHVFGRQTKGHLPIIAGGEGVWLIDSNGKRYLDGCGGAAISSLGHSNFRVLEAAKAQLDAIAFAHTGFFTSEPAELLADRLIEKAPAGIDRVYLVSGGSEAVESAIKLARQYFVEIGEDQRAQVISRWQSYHGNTLGALAAGGNKWRRAQFEPLLAPAMHQIDPCYFWRFGEEGETAFDYGQRMADQLEVKILDLGAQNVAAFIAEPVVGATMGAVAAEDGYFKRIREICDKYGVLLILDEVMCGAGRVGSFFASEQDDVLPDIICMAKGLGAGIQPIGAMLCSEKIYDGIRQGSGFFQHGHTYMGHPVAAATALAVLDEIDRNDLLKNVQEMGDLLLEKLNERLGQNAHVGDIRGRGLLLGLELVQDRQTKTPFESSLGLNKIIKRIAMEQGLMIYPFGGTVDGQSGDHILLAPPFIFTPEDVGELVERLGKSVDLALREIGID
ncbi:MAG: aspartate aminotransferase family protein [Devosiaceae bacterium]|nr:aspartate aminotransferase family protein [Devosiaceae bacterium]